MSAHERHVSSDSFILKIFIGHFCAWNGLLLNKEGMHRADTDRIHIYRNFLSIKAYELYIQILLEFYDKWMESKRLETLIFHKIWIWIVLHCSFQVNIKIWLRRIWCIFEFTIRHVNIDYVCTGSVWNTATCLACITVWHVSQKLPISTKRIFISRPKSLHTKEKNNIYSSGNPNTG